MNPEFWAALEQLVNNSEIVIDRPKGSAQGILIRREIPE